MATRHTNASAEETFMLPPHSLIQRIAADRQEEIRARSGRPRFRDDGSIVATQHSVSLPAHALSIVRRAMGTIGERTLRLRTSRHAARG